MKRLGAVLYDTAGGGEAAVFDRVVNEGDGEDFAAALRGLASFCAGYPLWTYGDAERLLKESCHRCRLPFPLAKPMIKVRSLLPGWGVRPSRYSAATLYAAAGLPNDGTSGALHDARSVARAVNFFENIELL